MPELSYDKQGNIIQDTTTPAPSLSPPTQSNMSQPEIRGRINLLAANAGLDPKFVGDIVNQESGFNPNAENPKELSGGGHAQGLFQFTPQTAKQYGVTNRFDPSQSIPAGIKFLSDLNKQYGGDKRKIAIHYNAGPSHVNDKFEDLPDETQDYLTKLFGEQQAKQPSQSEISYDKNGNVIGGNNPSIIGKVPQGQVPNPLAYKATPQTSEQAANALNETMGNVLPYALGGIGEIVGGPVGSALGTGLGEGLKRPLTTGSNPNLEDVSEAGKGAAASYATHLLLGTAPSALKKYIKGRVVNKVEQAAKGIESTRQDIVGFPSGQPTPQESNELKAKLGPVKAAETNAWDAVNKRMDANVQSFPAANGAAQFVRGPIEMSQDTLNYINNTKAQLEQLVKLTPNNPKLIQAYRSLDSASRSFVTDAQTKKSYLPFDVAKQLRTDIGNVTSAEQQFNLQAQGKSIGASRGGGLLTGLRDKLGNDVESSLAGMGPDALNEYASATGLTKSRVKASLIDKMLQRSTNFDTGQLDITKAINEIKKGAISSQFTGEEKDALIKTLNATRNVSPDYNGSLKYNAGKWVFYTAYGAMHPMTAAKAAVAFSTKDLFNAALTQPRYARILAQLPSAPANSSQAKMITKSFLKGAAKGLPADIVTADGKRTSAHIDENGNPIPDFQIGAQ